RSPTVAGAWVTGNFPALVFRFAIWFDGDGDVFTHVVLSGRVGTALGRPQARPTRDRTDTAPAPGKLGAGVGPLGGFLGWCGDRSGWLRTRRKSRNSSIKSDRRQGGLNRTRVERRLQLCDPF